MWPTARVLRTTLVPTHRASRPALVLIISPWCTQFDPFKLSKNATPEKKAKGLLAEINNGRLAMIGLFGFMAEAATPGSVPGLASVGIRPYDGDIMAPFAANFHIF